MYNIICVFLFLIFGCKRANGVFMNSEREQSTYCKILDHSNIKKNAKRCLKKLDKKNNYGYDKAIEKALKKDKCLVWGYVNQLKKLVPNCLILTIFDYYFGIAKEHENRFKNELENDYERSDINSCNMWDGYNFFHENNLNTIFSDYSFKNLLVCNRDFKRIIKLHRSGFLKIPQEFYLAFPPSFIYAYKSFPFITRYLLENTKGFDSSSYLKYILVSCFRICSLYVNNDELIKIIKNTPCLVAISIIYSKDCYEKIPWLADNLYKLDVDLCYNDYTRNIVKTLQEIYLGV